jgi:hypothetical protein
LVHTLVLAAVVEGRIRVTSSLVVTAALAVVLGVVLTMPIFRAEQSAATLLVTTVAKTLLELIMLALAVGEPAPLGLIQQVALVGMVAQVVLQQ